MRKLILLFSLFLLTNPLYADWKINPTTGELDYYEAGTTGAPTTADYLVGTAS